MFRETSYWSFPEKVYGYCLRNSEKQESIVKENPVKNISNKDVVNDFPDMNKNDFH